APAAEVRTTSGELAYQLFRAPAGLSAKYDTAAGLSELDASAGGVARLAGYRAEGIEAGQPSTIAIEWQVLAMPPPGTQLRQFAHVVDASGAEWSTGPDAPHFPASGWQAGQWVVSWFDLAPKADTPS